MATNTEVKKVGFWEQYGNVVVRLLLLPPQKVERWLNGETTTTKTPLMVKVFFMLVIGLSLASIGNIGTRAYFYHANWFSYITGACLALVVPASVFVASHFKGLTKKERGYAWGVAVFAALLSSFIQVKLYMTETDITLKSWLTGNIDIEALSFSAGIPFFEVLIASLASMVTEAHQRAIADEKETTKQEEKRLADEAEALHKKTEEEETKRKLQAEKQALEMDGLRMELDIKRKQLEAQIETQKQAALEEAKAKAEAIRINAEAKVERAKAKNVVQESVQNMENSGKQIGNKKIDERKLMLDMLPIIQSNPSISNRKLGEELGTSHVTVSKLLSTLLSKEVIDIEGEGRGRQLRVNGNHEAFLAGKL